MWGKNTFEFLTQKNLKGKYTTGRQQKDLSKIKFNELERIMFLDLSGNQLIDISPLKELEQLEILVLNTNQLSDSSPLKELNNLRELYIMGNPVPGGQIGALRQSLLMCDIWG